MVDNTISKAEPVNSNGMSNTDVPLVAVVIVHWINMDDTVECLESLASVDYPRLVPVLVNNGSPDFDESRLRKANTKQVVVTSQDNLGFTGGNNLGMHKAMELGADYVLLLNNDTTVDPMLISAMLPAFNDPKVGIAGPVINYYYEPEKTWWAGGQYSNLVGYSYRTHPVSSFDGTRPVDWISGCALMVKREVIGKIGVLWNPFFLNCEDIEFCLRAGKAGYTCLQVGAALVRHKVSASGGLRGSDNFSPNKAYYFARNQLLLLRLNAKGIWALTGLISQFVLIFPYWTLQSILARNLAVVKDYLIGLWDGLRGFSGKRPATR